ncbi:MULTISPECIES: Type 1 glutamine amidotransferase-like domain-containing protein [unclassified Rhodococcus (in: high G+C Gram-positive bacteria)]|uniref:Type 1 glutamine amidotransferase-like domain-containing protein n=1 Tax=unclassified Rhodococcus (in: high G+C Gram-positive bacteria) TaxID=192944 RepID=UPI000BD4CDED|nr:MULTISPECIES: Type 1 glutamine amidotransferase-like domain-containing protein [unclassified Rhodococcus (in: high G+C Gram-positive bacteria)]MBP1159753.1 dipeptidase E [Rhodococcus sp. PvR099]PTR37522.1 dipeptidase E [Rhodococcus sp. OK611]SNX93428.1 dipeptidase E [Rhodococcus sp. OK270]
MRLFLSSYRFGADPDRLLRLLGEPGPVAVIANAADAWEVGRDSAVVSDVTPLRRMGFDARELDLREFIGDPESLRAELTKQSMVWVRGGNTFVLRAQFARSGADVVLPELLRADALVYAGYSAGACVMSPSLRGLELLDDPAEVGPACGTPVIWEGLGLIDQAIVPHFRSPGYGSEETALLEEVAERYRLAGIPYRTLTDDDAMVVDGRI